MNMFQAHRDTVIKQLEHPLIITGFDKVQRVNDAAYDFTQESSFWYFTGIEEAGWRLIINDNQSFLVAPDVDEVHRIFDGGMSSDEARTVSGVDTILSAKDGDEMIRILATKHDTVMTLGKEPYASHYDFITNPAPDVLRRKLKKLYTHVEDIRPELSKLRAIKSDDELASMQGAIDITIDAFSNLYNTLSTKEFEYHIEAALTHDIRSAGASGHAYDPIIAAGKNACTLHYVKNDHALPKNGLVLIDVGARYKGYAADITRTYAIGTPTERQKAVHAAVEKAHHDIIALIRPGLLVKEYSEAVDEIMHRALDSLHLLKTEEDYHRYFPHAISHGLGVDVHDSLGGTKDFKPGMVLTVEPGIYIPEEEIGVRIEDDILVTHDGCKNLSGKLSTAL